MFMLLFKSWSSKYVRKYCDWSFYFVCSLQLVWPNCYQSYLSDVFMLSGFCMVMYLTDCYILFQTTHWQTGTQYEALIQEERQELIDIREMIREEETSWRRMWVSTMPRLWNITGSFMRWLYMSLWHPGKNISDKFQSCFNYGNWSCCS